MMSSLIKYSAGMKKQFTATGYVVNQDHTRMLMIFHKTLECWLPPGGHVDPDEYPADAALREVLEETGVRARHVKPGALDLELDAPTEVQLPTPLAMAAQLIPESPKDVEHIHMDAMYLLVADDHADLAALESEVHDVRWFSKNEVLGLSETKEGVRRFAHKQLQDIPVDPHG